MPKLLPQQYAKVLYELTKDTSEDKLDSVVEAFVDFLKSEHSLKKIDFIMKYFEAYAKEQQGISKIHVTSARKLSEKVLSEVKEAFGKDTEVTTEINEELVGGIIVRSKNTILDGSIKSQIELLRRELV